MSLFSQRFCVKNIFRFTRMLYTVWFLFLNMFSSEILKHIFPSYLHVRKGLLQTGKCSRNVHQTGLNGRWIKSESNHIEEITRYSNMNETNWFNKVDRSSTSYAQPVTRKWKTLCSIWRKYCSAREWGRKTENVSRVFPY